MKNIANLLFEAKILKEIPRAGYHFLGVGKETVAEHSFMITLIGYVMAKMEPEADALKLISMCLLHDLPEARTGDLNYVQKKYVTVKEEDAIRDATKNVPFGKDISELLQEFNQGETLEARLAKDADQISFILELKSILDVKSSSPKKWLPTIIERIRTETGKKLVKSILETEWDTWWLKNYID
ncbi:MAG: HD domain-containing protein [Proteobacteria bacterium]|nr:HD domain-containing protein [Pseudomonadota bacterium]